MLLIQAWEHFLVCLFFFTLFAIFHSVTAQESFKNFLARIFGSFFVTHYWRFLYCCLSFYFLYVWIVPVIWNGYSPFNNPLWTYPRWLQPIINGIGLLGLLVLYTAFLQSDYLEFWGLKQLEQGLFKAFRREPRAAEIKIFGEQRLVVGGIYRYIRHPMLAGGFLIVATASPTVNNLIFAVLFFLYMVIGVYYEEKRLIKNFGNQYHLYKSQVGGFLPRISRFKNA